IVWCICSSMAWRSGCTWASRARRCWRLGASPAAGRRCYSGWRRASKEDTASCRDFLRDLKARGLNDPLLIATDGAPGLIRAVEEVFPKSLRQRCLAHKIRNLESKVPQECWREVKARALAAY